MVANDVSDEDATENVESSAVPDETDTTSTVDAPAEKQADEVYCTSCGEPIKKDAEICPQCGVRQSNGGPAGTGASTGSMPDHRAYELQKVASKDITTVMVVSFLLTPAGYWMIGKTGLAIINFLTFNYFLLGFIIVPFHTRKIIKEAREELERNSAGW